MHNHAIQHGGGFLDGIVMLFGLLLIMVYVLAAAAIRRRGRAWPAYRSVLWATGILFAAAGAAGPLAELGHTHFTAHMVCHLLLGMLAPYLIVLAAPMTLVLRVLPVHPARRFMKLLNSRPVRVFHDPIVAALFNIGGLCVLYTTELYSIMQNNMYVQLWVHAHFFIAGYLYTDSLIGTHPTPQRPGFMHRVIVWIVASACHGILSKIIYAHHPDGVSAAQAEEGAMLMYYGGDLVEVFILFTLCIAWFKAYEMPNARLVRR